MFIRLIAVIAIFLVSATARSADIIIPAPPQLAASGYLLLDASTGKVLVEHNSRQRLPPASLTKIMTSYIISEEMDRGRLSEDDEVEISVKAWRMGGSRMFIREGTRVKVGDLLRGIVIQSGNDASVAMAEHIAGSEDQFADMMNQHAMRLGMTDTHFVNATGWPSEDHYTTARDLATLTIALINDHPTHYDIYSEKYFTYNDIRQPNRNTLLWKNPAVDGVKTGHTEAAGYCLVASAKKDGMRLISVVMGTRSEEARASESQKLLTYGFRYFETMNLYKANESLSKVRVWSGNRNALDLGVAEDVQLTLPRGAKDQLSARLDIDSVIKAPINSGTSLGKLTVSLGDEVVYEGSLVALTPVEEAGFFARLWDAIALFFLQLMGGDPLKVP
ncbi:MAG: D-alanyl-D-alanine carboxypeptidase [Pseudomonadales bacterium]|nr:D-alanyl-D-alanine carboxypeptidase [Pseudomonadales bacterium]